ncbi:MAG: WecB/TagA/CpsF family glycosyltransferase [Clostridiales bacterium]|nr:WecB/TagA/CpsF family glycosyltransferase [Clostridiales bacterium]
MENVNKINVLGINFNNVKMQDAVNKCNEFLLSDKLNMIITPNPEIVMHARKNEEFKNIINNSELVIPDGIGVIYGSKILKTPLKERVAGFDLICNLFENTESSVEKKVYILGAKPGVAQIAKQKLEEKYNLKVVGLQDGYFNQDAIPEIIENINLSGANILLVGLGMEKQEKFIYDNKDKLNVKIAIGCGGTIDVFAGTVKRAPKIFQKLGLEWFYRLLKQPSRIGRMMVLPKFLLVVLFKGKKESK